MSNHPTLSYQHAAALGASPLGQIIALYDTILRDFQRALAALKAGNVETRVFELNHAITVISHLQGALDHERGEEAASQLELLYNVTRAMIVSANLRATPESLEELIEMYGGLRQAWYEAEKQLPAGQQRSPVINRVSDAAAVQGPRPANDDAEIPQFSWSV